MEKTDLKANQKYYYIDSDIYLKVMAIVDNYVMARFKGCIPFVESISIFTSKYAAWSDSKPYDEN